MECYAASQLLIARAIDRIMAERISEPLQKKIEERLRYHEDLGIRLFYLERGNAGQFFQANPRVVDSQSAAIPVIEEISLSKSAPKRKPEPRHPASSFRAISVRIGG